MLKYLPVVAILLGSSAAFAQGAAQTPPAPGAASSEAQSPNSLPAGASNMNLNSSQNPYRAGQDLGGTTTAPR